MGEKANNLLLIEEIRNIHKELKLRGKPQNALLYVSDDLLSYVLSLLRDEVSILPDASKSEWDELISVLRPHTILPLLYWKIGLLPRKLRPPKNITIQIVQAFLQNHANCLQMQKQLHQIIEAFNSAGINVLVLKGLSLAMTVYPGPATRLSRDIDLLVCPEQMIQARKTLLDLDYKCLEERFENSRDFYCDEYFIHQSNKDNIRVELHWTWHKFAGTSRGGSIHDIFKRTIEVKQNGISFNAMHPVDNLIHCALHLSMFHNKDIRLMWINDVALLFKYIDEKDYWKALQKSSDEWMARLALENSLKMAQGWTGLKLTRENNLLNWPAPEEHEIAIWSNSIQRHKSIIKMFTMHWKDSSNIFEKIKYFFCLLFPNPDMMRRSYPTSNNMLLPLSYIHRWWKWIKKLILRV